MKASRMNQLVAGALVIMAIGCGQSSPTGDVDKIKVETSSLFVTVTNTAGLALNEVRVEINPAGGAAPYTSFIGRMENTDKRDVNLSAFRDRDGVPFSLRAANPRSVTVSGNDINGKTMKVEVPWK